MKNLFGWFIVFLALQFPRISSAQDLVPLLKYLEQMNHAEVSLQGHLKFDDSHAVYDKFTFYDKNGKYYAVKIDAGRKARERLQEFCLTEPYQSRNKMCVFEGSATIEIDGSSIILSIDRVDSVTK